MLLATVMMLGVMGVSPALANDDLGQFNDGDKEKKAKKAKKPDPDIPPTLPQQQLSQQQLDKEKKPKKAKKLGPDIPPLSQQQLDKEKKPQKLKKPKDVPPL